MERTDRPDPPPLLHRPGCIPTGGPGRVAKAGLQQSIATREPYFEPRRETICFLIQISRTVTLQLMVQIHTEHELQQLHDAVD